MRPSKRVLLSENLQLRSRVEDFRTQLQDSEAKNAVLECKVEYSDKALGNAQKGADRAVEMETFLRARIEGLENSKSRLLEQRSQALALSDRQRLQLEVQEAELAELKKPRLVPSLESNRKLLAEREVLHMELEDLKKAHAKVVKARAQLKDIRDQNNREKALSIVSDHTSVMSQSFDAQYAKVLGILVGTIKPKGIS